MPSSRAIPKLEIFSTLFSPTSTFLQARSLWTIPNSDMNSCSMRREGDGEKGKDPTVNYVSVKVHMKQHQTLISLERHFTKAHREYDNLISCTSFVSFRTFMNRERITQISWLCLSCDSDTHKARTHIEGMWLAHIWGLSVDSHRWSVYTSHIINQSQDRGRPYM